MKSGYLIYDTHTHLGTARHTGRRCSTEDMLRHMDAGGVDRSILLPFPVVEDPRARTGAPPRRSVSGDYFATGVVADDRNSAFTMGM